MTYNQKDQFHQIIVGAVSNLGSPILWQFECIGACMRFPRHLCLVTLAGLALFDISAFGRGKQDSVTDYAGQPSVSMVVTIHELSHTPPPKAINEAKKGAKARAANLLSDAIEHYQRAVAIDPAYVAARNNLGKCLLDLNPSSAIEQFEAAIAIDPLQPVLYMNIALAYSLMHRHGDAERAARQAVTLDRAGSHRAAFVLGLVLYHRNRFSAEALKCLQLAQASVPATRFFVDRIASEQQTHGEAPPAETVAGLR
jgi:tetratricopeptide (TPR) repeat protein